MDRQTWADSVREREGDIAGNTFPSVPVYGFTKRFPQRFPPAVSPPWWFPFRQWDLSTLLSIPLALGAQGWHWRVVDPPPALSSKWLLLLKPACTVLLPRSPLHPFTAPTLNNHLEGGGAEPCSRRLICCCR